MKREYPFAAVAERKSFTAAAAHLIAPTLALNSESVNADGGSVSRDCGIRSAEFGRCDASLVVQPTAAEQAHKTCVEFLQVRKWEPHMAKKLKLKVPKRIAGVKIPKGVRQGPLADFLNSSGGQVVLAECLAIAAGALAMKGSDPASPKGQALRHPLRGAKRAGYVAAAGGKHARELMAERSSRLASAFGEAAQAFRAAMQATDIPQTDSDLDRPDSESVLNAQRSEPVEVTAEDDRAKKKRSTPTSDAGRTPH